MRPASLGLALLVSGLVVVSTAAVSGDALSTGPDCGPDAFSSAQVIENRPPRRGPITAMPDTLCADLAPQQPPPRIDIYANPLILPENGEGRGRAPYDVQSPHHGGPPRPYSW